MAALPPRTDLSAKSWATLSLLAVLIGSSFIIVQYLWRQSYWGDEVSILTNIGRKRISEFFVSGLDHSQAAPPLFLVAQKLFWLAFGPGEYSQRFLPMLMGVGAMAAFGALCWRLLPPGAATFALAIFCFSDKLITHATEVKQYAGDVLFAICLLWLAAGAVLDGLNIRRFAWLSLLAAIAVWASHTVVFVYAGISLVVVGRLFTDRRAVGSAAARWAYIACNLLFLISFAALYVLSICHQRDDRYLQDFWRTDFVDPTHPLTIPFWLVTHLWSVCGYVVTPVNAAAVPLVALMLAGLIAWVRQRRWALAGLCFAPLGWVIIASAVGAYPLSGARIDFFLIPGLLIAAGEGLIFIEQLQPAQQQRWAGLLFPLLLIPLLAVDCWAMVFPRVRMNVRPVAEDLRIHRRPDEPIFAGSIREVFLWYWPDVEPPVLDTVPVDPTSSRTFWFIAAERPENLMRDEKPNLDLISHHATEIRSDRLLVRGGVAFHFQENNPLTPTVPEAASVGPNPPR